MNAVFSSKQCRVEGKSEGVFSNPWIRTAAKSSLAVTVLTWMVRSGRLELPRLLVTLPHWPQLLAILTIFYIEIFVMAWRWNILLAAQGFSIGLRQAFSFTMIGSLFNVVMPSTVGGDIVRGYYVSRSIIKNTPEAITTILLDRIVGLLGLVTLAAVAGACYLGVASENRTLEVLCLLAIAMAAAGGFVLMLGVVISSKLTDLRCGPPNRWLGFFMKAIRSLDQYRQSPMLLVSALAASIFIHLLSCIAFYLAVQTLEGPSISWGYYFLVVPLGLMTTAIPISILGLGVGQAAFFTLFQLIPGGSGILGANACTVFQLLLILVYLTGSYSYLTYRPITPEESAVESRTL